MIDVGYDFYTDTYKGKMSEEEYKRLTIKAAAFLEQITCGRINQGLAADSLQKAKLACCEVTDAYLLNEAGGGKASESNDGLTVTYVAGISNTKTEGQRLYEAAALYLADTGLMYRGVG